jgi:Conjugative transposon, TraM
MEKKMITAKEQRQRLFLLWAPVMAFPVLALLFWGMGGGHAMAGAFARTVAHGFNMRVPAAHLGKVSKMGKMDYYEQAAKDSVAVRQKRSIEENYARVLGLESDSVRRPVSVDPVVRTVRDKLAELKKALGASSVRNVPTSAIPTSAIAASAIPAFRPVKSPEMEQLEKAMAVVQQREAGTGNREMAELSQMLDKLSAVQGLGRKPDSGRSAVPAHRATVMVTALRDSDDTLGAIDSTVIEAMSPEEQILVSGGQLRLELIRDVAVEGRRIPAGTPVFGTVALSGERLRVSITAIAWQGHVFPVNFGVADEDGGLGIYIPGAPMSDAVRESAQEEVGSFGPEVLSTTAAGQAATAGVGLARSLIAKKVRPVRVTIPAGYRVFLHLQNQGL